MDSEIQDADGERTWRGGAWLIGEDSLRCVFAEQGQALGKV